MINKLLKYFGYKLIKISDLEALQPKVINIVPTEWDFSTDHNYNAEPWKLTKDSK